jgi:hypothetical protein
MIGIIIALFASTAFPYCNDYNRYQPGTGHYAVFAWPIRHSVDTRDINSRSLVEGCYEFLWQK